MIMLVFYDPFCKLQKVKDNRTIKASFFPIKSIKLLSHTYLIFVISFTQAGFLNSKVLHPKTTQNTHKLQQIPQKDVKYAVICVQSGKIYTGQNFFTRAPPVVPVTNMRYDIDFLITIMIIIIELTIIVPNAPSFLSALRGIRRGLVQCGTPGFMITI